MICDCCLEGFNPRAALPSLNWIRAFAVVGHEGSYAAAARAIGVSDTRVRSGVESLEGYVSGPLVISRQGREPELTRAGLLRLKTCRSILAHVAGLQR